MPEVRYKNQTYWFSYFPKYEWNTSVPLNLLEMIRAYQATAVLLA